MSVKKTYRKKHKQLRATLAAHSLLIEIRHRGTPTIFLPKDQLSAAVFKDNEVLKWLLEVAYPLLQQSENNPWTKTYELAELKIEGEITKGMDTLKNIQRSVYEYSLLMIAQKAREVADFV
jgi:hypothetical protein